MMKQILISTFMVTISLIANCQDTVYFDKNLDSIDKHSASYFQIKRDDPSFPGRLIVETFYMNGSRKEIRYYTDRTEKIQTGVSQKWHSNGQIKSKINYENGLLSDTLFTFWENGQLKRQDIYIKMESLLRVIAITVQAKRFPILTMKKCQSIQEEIINFLWIFLVQ